MTQRIEDYALIGDCSSAALVGKNGSIDWLCLPDFDHPAVFSAILGGPQNGHWQLAPSAEVLNVRRAYRPGTMILQTTIATAGGRISLTDAMIGERDQRRIVRIIDGLEGNVPMHMEYVVRFDYGSVVPWVQKVDAGLIAAAGSKALLLTSEIELRAEGRTTVADFCIASGERLTFELTYLSSFGPSPKRRSPQTSLAAVERAAQRWNTWSEACTYTGPYRDVVSRSLLTLRALTYEPTGAIVAAPTMSLPERLGGVRNWDYRFCWLRDATLTLQALLQAGYDDTARAWRGWLVRAIAGAPDELQVMYDIRADRHVPERELFWLAGYEGALPVRVGNSAAGQFQLDVYGEVIDFLYTARSYGLETTANDWSLFRAIVGEVEKRWQMPDRGMWEIRGPEQHFTLSKVSAWVALDRAVKAVEEFGIDGPLERWRSVREAIAQDIWTNGFDATRNTFTQAYGSKALDAGALLILRSGFLSPDDPRARGTIAAIEGALLHNGLVYRYDEKLGADIDGLPVGEGAFLACSFWLVDAYALSGRGVEARRLFERLISLCNDVGLLAEEYDPATARMLGNFPQAFSHVGLIISAFTLWHTAGAAPSDAYPPTGLAALKAPAPAACE